jgi:hypothetical protein
LVDASVSVEVLIDDEPRAMEDASDGLGRLQSVENASDLAQPIYQDGFRGVRGAGRNGYQGVGHDTSH